ncbi:MAG TPA: hypothetical protein DIC35_05585 [Candidatus Moranbacteria bacterium]|nr:hypothetical protein [Candidatus Moranbacteria bacterium]
MLESAIERGLGGNFFSPEEAKFLMEDSTEKRKENEPFKKAEIENVESEFEKIQEMMGISAAEIKMFYESITPEDAKDIVVKTIEKIPSDFMKGDQWKIDSLKKFGGRIMCWASMKSPMEAPMIAASIMIITMGEGNIADCIPGETNYSDQEISQFEVEQEKDAFRNYPINSRELHKGIQ